MKKFLSLVLAMIMTMSLVTISAGATEYKDLTDKDEIQYEEAVAVLNRIGVITGYDDGSFRPEGELTRGAAAKIIVSLLIGPENANNLPNSTAPYPDVPANHTFAGVISYCKTAKIISGYGDGTFKPGNSLTGFAFAKMLLGALGYKQEIEGFVDTGWTMNVGKVGSVVGLFDRLDFDGSAAVNREEACQLALNTLKATMVTYGGTTMVTGAQNMFVQGTQAMYVTSNNREINANINRRVISAQNNELTLEFGEEHFKDLRLEHDKYDPAYDDFGHPSNEWSWKKVTIGTFKLPADFTYTNQVAYREDTVAAKEKALGLRGYDTFSTDHRGTNYNWSSPLGGGSYTGVNSPFDDATQITINGYNARANAYGALVSYDASKITNKTDAPTLSEIADLTDNGVTVEVYVCPVDADFITNVVVTRTQLMKVKRIGSDYVTLERISPDSRDPRKDEAEKDSIQGLRDITGYNAFAIDVDTLDVKDNNYDAYNTLKDLKAGDRVAVVPFTADQGKTWEVGEAYVPETVSGKLSDVGLYMNTSKTDGNATSITVGGTKYVINEWNLDMIDVKKAQINATRKDVTAYLAKDGTVLWATEIGNSDDWMIVGDYYQAANSNGKVVWFAHGWTIGGEEVNVDLGTIRKEAEYYAPGELVHYQLAQGGTGEYELGKPNNTGFSSWYSHDGDQIPEDRLTKTVNNKKEYSGEGVYNVAQYVLNNGESKPYSIHPANSLIALEDYTNYLYPATANTAYGGAIYGDEYTVNADNTITITANEGAGHKWDYRSTTYNNDGVKFIYVNFDSVTGNVDYISTRKDAQTVENAELAGYNKWWYNTATNVANDQRNWVVSPAEAYVNDDGNVEAVVIKCEPAQADLSNVIIVGEYVGTEYGKTGAETSATNPSNVSAREYWQGPTFSEKKTGYFKNGHNVGDIVVIRSTDANNVMDCKMFNGGNFENRNPDVFTANGIAALKSAMDEKSKVAFYVGKNSGDTVLSQNGKINLVSSKADIMSDIKVEAEDWDNLTELEKAYYEGLIKVSGAKWIDLRANRGSDEVESLGDLLDLDNDAVQIKVLLNAKSSTETFRRAYAIVVLRGYKLNQVDIPSLSIQAVENATYADAKKGDGTAKNPWVFETSVGTDVRLHGVFKNASKLTGKVTSKVWTINDRTVSSDFVSDNDSIWVEAPEVKGEAYGKLVSWTVTVRDDSKVDRRTASTTVYAKIVIPSDPVVVDDVVINVADLPEGVTFTDKDGNLVEAKDGKITLEEGETYTLGAPEGFTVSPETFVAGTTKVEDIELTEVLPTGFDKIEGVEGAEVVFAELDDPSKTYTAKVGESVELPTGVYLTVSASDSANHALARKNVGSEPVPYANAFKIENVDSVLVYVKGTGSEFSPAWDADATNGGNGLTRIPKAAEAGAAEVLEETLVSSAPAAGSAYVKVTTPDGVAFLSAETTGKNAGLFSLVEEDADGNKCPVTIADVAAALNESEDNAEDVDEADVTYGNDDPGPGPGPELPETVKAEISGSTATLFAYRGPKGTDTVELDEAQVKAALVAAGVAIRELNMKAGTVTTTAGQTLTLSPAPSKGVVKNPTPLFKVTAPDGTDSYLKSGAKLSGLGDIKAIIEKGSVAGASGAISAVDVDGKSAALTLSKDTVYAEALPVKSNCQSACPTDPAGDGSITGIAFDVYYTNKDGVQTKFSSTAGVEKGTELTFFHNYTASAGKAVTLYVNGKAVGTGTYAANGNCDVKYTVNDVDDTGVLAFWVVADGAKVSFNGTTYTPVGGVVNIPSTKAGVALVVVGANGALAAPTTAVTAAPGGFKYTVNNSDYSEDGVITLAEAYPVAVDESGDTPVWTGFVDSERKVAIADDATNTSFVLADGTGKIYINASTKNTTLKLADTTNAKNLVLTPDTTYIPSAYQQARYVVTVNGPVAPADIVVDFKVPDESQAAVAAADAATGAGTTNVTTTFTVAKTAFVVPADLDAEIEVDWKSDPTIATTLNSATWNSSSGLVIGATIKADATADAAIGTVTVKWNGLTFDVPLKAHA